MLTKASSSRPAALADRVVARILVPAPQEDLPPVTPDLLARYAYRLHGHHAALLRAPETETRTRGLDAVADAITLLEYLRRLTPH